MTSKGTPHRPIRIDGETWAKAQAKAARLGTSASAKARELLTEWANEPDDTDGATLADAWDEGFVNGEGGDEYPINPYRA